MASQKMILLTDFRGNEAYFEEKDLVDQVFASGIIEMQGASKAAALNLARKVQEMREWQRRYFAAAHGSNEKQAALNKSKAFERAVDDLIRKYLQTVPNL